MSFSAISSRSLELNEKEGNKTPVRIFPLSAATWYSYNLSTFLVSFQ